MAEFAAFHYLMHKNVKSPGGSGPSMSMDEFAKQFGRPEKGPPTFPELYSPRPTRQLHVAVKLYWRTNDRIEYRFVEVRAHSVLVIMCLNTTTSQEYRPLCVDAELLYKLVENKKQGKPWNTAVVKRMLSDVELKAAVPDFLLSRLKLSEPPTSTESTAPSATERHCFLEKSFGDEYDTLLCDPPPVALETLLDGVERKGTPIWLSQPVDVPSSIVIPTSEVQASTDTTPPADVRESVPAGGSGAVAVRVLKTATSSPKKDAKQLKGGSTKPAKPGQIKAKP